MTIIPKIHNFPSLHVSSQLFHVPNSYVDGGLTSGGAVIMSPNPGGRSVLEIGLSLQVKEWEAPFSSWLMSKLNGEIFKLQMVKTPQLVSISDEEYESALTWDNDQPWDGTSGWLQDGAYMFITSEAREGEVILSVETSTYGKVIRHGHVIGIGNVAHIVDDIEYNESVATLTLKPPLRSDVAVEDRIIFRPYFLGTIANGPSIRNSYEASQVGHIQLPSIKFNEAVI